MEPTEIRKALLRAYFQDSNFPFANLESFTKFVRLLPSLFEKYGSRSWNREQTSFQLGLSQPELQPPQRSPEQACRARTSYVAPLTAHLELHRNGELLQSGRVTVCEVPLMVQPTAQDLGGYFIINGTERVIITQEILCNMPHIVKYSPSKNEYYAASGKTSVSIKLAVRLNGPILVTKLGYQNGPQRLRLPVAILFLALGVRSIEAALRLCLVAESSTTLQTRLSRLLPLSWKNLPEGVKDKQTALQHLAGVLGCKERGSSATEYAEEILCRICFTYYPTPELKAAALGLMVYRLLQCSCGEQTPHDVHHIGRKRYERVGGMLHNMLRSSLRGLLSRSSKSVDAADRKGKLDGDQQQQLELQTWINANIITNSLCSAVGRGNLGRYEGISQVLNRMNDSSQVSHLCAIQKYILKQAKKSTEPRSYHLQSAVGFIDPHHTPEGEKCGIIIYPTLFSKYSCSSSYRLVWDEVTRVFASNLRGIEATLLPTEDVLLFFNGVWKGSLRDCTRGNPNTARAVALLRIAKFRHRIPSDCSIYYLRKPHEIHIWCDENRLLRPLIRLLLFFEYLPSLNWETVSWNELLERGIIEYVSAFEAESLCIAECLEDVQPDYHSHCELSGLALMSYSSAKIAYGHLDPACRITYSDAQSKQAVPLCIAPVSGDHHRLWYAQKPLAASSLEHVALAARDRYEGVNVLVAVASYTGYNQEDSIIMCKAAADRGLFNSFFIKCYLVEEDEGRYYLIGYDDGAAPGGCWGDKSGLQQNGLPTVGTRLEEGQAVIGVSCERDGKSRDASLIIKRGGAGIVQESTLTTVERADKRGRKLETKAACVKVRSLRIPQVGDKFSSRHGQKGTIGIMLPQEDMPFTVDGIVPDIIINPHAVPTRMTVGQFVEALASLVTCLTGTFFDATPLQSAFDQSPYAVEELLCKVLVQKGMPPLGKVAMMNGMTGELLANPVFLTPVYYQRLRHMVVDKGYARARGPRNSITHQPTEGRSKNGGIRFGEMERDCMISHGASVGLHDRLTKNSDAQETALCKSCGLFGMIKTTSGYRCRDSRCVGNTIVRIVVPYSLQLFFKELMSLNITARVRVRPTSLTLP